MKKSTLLLFASALALSACGTSTTNNVAKEEVAGAQSGIDKSLMDTSVAAGDDFEEHAGVVVVDRDLGALEIGARKRTRRSPPTSRTSPSFP